MIQAAKQSTTSLTQPISTDAPSGADLEYDAQFGDMERAAQGKEEQQYGETVIDAEPPDWPTVKRLARQLCQRTHDLRAGVYLAEAVIEDDGIAGFVNVLDMLSEWIHHEWETVHPQLDPADNHDPTSRVNTLARLTDQERILERLRNVALLEMRGVGRFTVGAAAELAEFGSSHQQTGSPLPLEVALAQFAVEPLLAVNTTMQQAVQAVQRLAGELETHVGIAESVEFGPLQSLFNGVAGVLQDRLERRGVDVGVDRGEADKSAAEFTDDDAALPEQHEQHEQPAENAGASRPLSRSADTTCDMPTQHKLPGNNSAHVGPDRWQIRDRHEVEIALERLCDFFVRNEPSSPIPLLLRRAKRLVPMNFLEILSDLAPEGLSQAQLLQGDTTSPTT